jgi:hypothetical protein
MRRAPSPSHTSLVGIIDTLPTRRHRLCGSGYLCLTRPTRAPNRPKGAALQSADFDAHGRLPLGALMLTIALATDPMHGDLILARRRARRPVMMAEKSV